MDCRTIRGAIREESLVGRGFSSIEERSLSTAIAAGFLEVEPQGGQRWAEEGRLGDVIDARDTDVIGNSEPRLCQRENRTERHLVVGRHHGSRTEQVGGVPDRSVARRC